MGLIINWHSATLSSFCRANEQFQVAIEKS
jgi:hypothetical protein